MIKYFGKDFSVNFYPLTADEQSYELLSTDAPTVYLFDEYPDEDQRSTGTGAIQTIGVWADTEDGYGKRIDFSVVLEPVDLQTFEAKYYVVITATLQSGQPISPVVKEVTLSKLKAHESIIDVSISDLLMFEPHLVDFCKCLSDLENYITIAIRELKASLAGCDFSFGNIVDPAQFKYAAAKLAISRFYFAQSRNPADKWYADGTRYSDEYHNEVKRLKIALDTDRDGKPDKDLHKNYGVRSLRILR